ncbi:MAG: CopG family transcriptional regulator [Actinomycetota bacterium]
MTFQRTQIYLDPDQHRKLIEEAASRGVSLAALLRDLVREHLDGLGTPAGEKSFDAITGIVDLDQPTDLVGDWDAAMSEAMQERYRKKSGTARRGRRPQR